MKLKVLPLERWMIRDLDPNCRWSDRQLGSPTHPETVPVFSRDGIYLRGKECWIEIHGKAFKYSVSSFKHTLDNLDAERYNQRQIEALVELRNQGLATKPQEKLLGILARVEFGRSSYRRSMLDRMKRLPTHSKKSRGGRHMSTENEITRSETSVNVSALLSEMGSMYDQMSAEETALLTQLYPLPVPLLATCLYCQWLVVDLRGQAHDLDLPPRAYLLEGKLPVRGAIFEDAKAQVLLQDPSITTTDLHWIIMVPVAQQPLQEGQANVLDTLRLMENGHGGFTSI